LMHPELPVLLLREHDGVVECRWAAAAQDFDMPITVRVKGEPLSLRPVTGEWREMGRGFRARDVSIDIRRFLAEIEISKKS
jgi:hypothetical protein